MQQSNLRFSDLLNSAKYDYQTTTPVAVTDGIYQRREPTYTLRLRIDLDKIKNKERRGRRSYGEEEFWRL